MAERLTTEEVLAGLEARGVSKSEVFARLINAWNGTHGVAKVTPLTSNQWTKKAWLRVFVEAVNILEDTVSESAGSENEQ